jgi:hypothetical protein
MLDGRERVGDGRGGCGMSGEGPAGSEDLRFVKTLVEGVELLVGTVFGLRETFGKNDVKVFILIPARFI